MQIAHYRMISKQNSWGYEAILSIILDELLKCNCLARPREIRKKWHMLEKFDILIFRPEIPYCESINVVYFLGEKLFVFSRKFSKTATAVKCPKLMPRVRIQKLCSSISQKEVGFFEIYSLV